MEFLHCFNRAIIKFQNSLNSINHQLPHIGGWTWWTYACAVDILITSRIQHHWARQEVLNWLLPYSIRRAMWVLSSRCAIINVHDKTYIGMGFYGAGSNRNFVSIFHQTHTIQNYYLEPYHSDPHHSDSHHPYVTIQTYTTPRTVQDIHASYSTLPHRLTIAQHTSSIFCPFSYSPHPISSLSYSRCPFTITPSPSPFLLLRPYIRCTCGVASNRCSWGTHGLYIDPYMSCSSLWTWRTCCVWRTMVRCSPLLYLSRSSNTNKQTSKVCCI